MMGFRGRSLAGALFAAAVAAADPVGAQPPGGLPPSAATAAPPPAAASPAQRHLFAVRVTHAPVLDGKLDDAVWQLAAPSSGFRQKVPNDGAVPSDPTTVRVLYDDDAIYVGFDCPQQHTPVTARLTRRDRVVEADSVSIDLGTSGDHKSAFEFSVNASGTLTDTVRFNDTDSSSDWDENWDARTHVTATGWTAEFRIPLHVLRFPALPVQLWDLQASRYISLRQETDYWQYYPRSLGGEVSHYGRLDGLRGLQPRTPIEVRPFLVGRLRRRDPSVDQLASGTDFLGSAGFDLKWHATQDLTLDATVNPDFAQIEADQVVLNLSTVATYYPEKRPFFLEGIDTFATPFQLLYTRRIGRVPPIPPLRDGEQLVDVPEPATIFGATKLTGRLDSKWTVGTLLATTARDDVLVQQADGKRAPRLVDPTSAFGVLRLKRDLGDNAHVGILTTAVVHAEPVGSYPLVAPGAGGPTTTALCPSPVFLTPFQQVNLNVRPQTRCFNDAYAAAFDWRWRSPGGDYSFGGQGVGSLLFQGPGRRVADGTVVNPGDIGGGMKVSFNKEGGTHWVGGVSAVVTSTKLDINDAGYLDRANQMGGTAQLEHRELDPHGWFRETHTFLSSTSMIDDRKLLTGQVVTFGNWGRLTNLWTYGIDAHYVGRTFDDREVGDGTALRREGRIGNGVYLETDLTKKVSIGFDQTTEYVFDGFNTSGSGTLSLRVLPQLDLDILPTWGWTFGEPRFMVAGSVPGQYLFGKLDARSIGATLRTTYTFFPRLTVQAYAQLFLASGHYSGYTQYRSSPGGPRPTVDLPQLTPYSGALTTNPDFEDGVLNVNLVLRWEYLLGSALYLVYTRAQVPTTVLDPGETATINLTAVRRAPVSDVILAKVSFWWGA
jgi:hypothetical protein